MQKLIPLWTRKKRSKSFICHDGNTLHNSEEAIIHYVAGYIAKSLSKSKCDACNVLISPEKEDLPLITEELSNDASQLIIEAKEEFTALVTIFTLLAFMLVVYIDSFSLAHRCAQVATNSHLSTSVCRTNY